MSAGTRIEWTDETWNIVTGCDRISPGCDACYIERTIPFRMEGRRFDERGKMGPRLHGDRLDQPIHWHKPRRVFVCSLADLFHDDVDDEFLAEAFARMAIVGHCTFQVLTKRSKRMRDLLGSDAFVERWWRARHDRAVGDDVQRLWRRNGEQGMAVVWPPPNIWLGVSVENQRYADLRIPHLLATAAAVRFLSCEPLLGPIDLIAAGAIGHDTAESTEGLVDWVIVGGESGPKSRPMHPQWVYDLRDQCETHEVPFFFKQWGEWAPNRVGWEDARGAWIEPGGEYRGLADALPSPDASLVRRVGKHEAGRVLDQIDEHGHIVASRTWDEYPTPRLGVGALSDTPEGT